MKPAMRNFLLVLIGALILTIAVRMSLGSKEQPKQADPPVRVLVAAHDLPAGMLLRDAELTWKDMPAGTQPKGAILQNSTAAKTLQGSLLHNPVTKGAPILSSDIISASDPGFLAASLKPGMRAVSVAINDVSGNAGLIQPGDYVDLLLTQSLQNSKSAARSVASETIATGLRVIAVGSTLQRPKDSDISSNTSARTVTLEVSPRAAEVISVAARMGDLSLVLRSFATNDPTQAPDGAPDKPTLSSSIPAEGPVWAGDISQAARAQATGNSDNSVQILRGGSSTQSNVGNAPAAPLQ